jgi:hypothetical protein
MMSRKKENSISTAGIARRKNPPAWVALPDEQLLDLRICDLNLRIQETPLTSHIDQLQEELDRRRLRFRPHFWLAEDWFSPDGIPGIAIPFYLGHPRLMRLERKMMLEVEGGTRESCMRILRHEVGHALDHAFLLHRRRKWQQLFGKSSKPYPSFYKPKPYSKNFVLHLDFWYAQSHPDEDFAETFAIWLTPKAAWKKRYQGWPALRKLEYVDGLMKEIEGSKPINTSRAKLEPLTSLRKTLREHYEEKRAQYGTEYPDFYDRDLRQLFSDAPEHAHLESAASFLRRVRSDIRALISRWTGQYQYTLDQVFKEMIGRCRDLKLHVAGPEKQLTMDFAILLTVQTMNYLHSGRHRVGM